MHWIPGLTRSVRSLLERQGFRSLEALQLIEPRKQARNGVLPESTWQRAKQGAEALATKRPVRVRKPRMHELQQPAAQVVALFDAFTERVPILAWSGAAPADGGGDASSGMLLRAEDRESEDLMWRRAFATLGDEAGSLVHAGGLPARLYESLPRFPALHGDVSAFEARALDVMALVRGTWIFPSPVSSAHEALAWLRGAVPEPREDSVALLLELGDWEALEVMAREELAAIRELLIELQEAS